MQGSGQIRARRYTRLPFVGGALLLLAALAAALPAGTAQAAPAGTLAMHPTNISAETGDTFAITLDVVGGVNIHGVHIGITYNTAVLQVIDAAPATPGMQVLPGPFPGDDTAGAVLQNAVGSGIVNYQYELDGAAEVSGDGTVATVQFQAIANGNANLGWSARILSDAADIDITASASAAIVVIGAAATETPAPAATDTPVPTATLVPAATATPTATGTAVATATPGGSVTTTATATRTATPIGTATATRTAAATSSPVATSTPRVTVLQDSNAGAPPAAGVEKPRGGVDPSQAARADGLPSAGSDNPGVIWWKWTFFGGALMLAITGWFFTFALHYGDRDVVLMDRFDARRKGLIKRLPK